MKCFHSIRGKKIQLNKKEATKLKPMKEASCSVSCLSYVCYVRYSACIVNYWSKHIIHHHDSF